MPGISVTYASHMCDEEGGRRVGSNNALTVTMGEIYLDEQEIFSESSTTPRISLSLKTSCLQRTSFM